jgi:hypothetical protein
LKYCYRVKGGDTDLNIVGSYVETVGEFLHEVLDFVKVALRHTARGVQQKLDISRHRAASCNNKNNNKSNTVQFNQFS